MTRDEIIRMALEVGFVAYGEDAGEYRIPTRAFYSRLERFAALVAAAERAHNYSLIGTLIFAEREACARLCEVRADEEIGMAYQGIALDCAAAIRARGQP